MSTSIKFYLLDFTGTNIFYNFGYQIYFIISGIIASGYLLYRTLADPFPSLN